VLCTVQGALWRKPVRTGQINGVYNYETRYFTQKLDHFSFATADVTTFQQRYLINVDSYEPGGPLFFYCGNEGDITWFCNNTGFMWEIAPDFKAMIVFAEHRYYGESLPFGKDSFSDLAHLGYLTSEQALADFDVLISSLREEYDSNLQVVAFGGSYGGMLSAWLRMKYPGAVVGAIAASAPIWQFSNLTDCELSYRVISDTLNQYSPICSSNVLQSWKAVYTIASGTDGLSWLSNAFFLCDPLAEPVLLINWLEGVWFNMAMCEGSIVKSVANNS
jgi:lysosomal Pro-X carboxypeptidase